MKATNSKVDGYLGRAKLWRQEMEALRAVLLDTPLTEELKWGKPCYTLQGGNVVLIVGFTRYCALLFFKGALLKNQDGILVQPTENTQAARQIRFTALDQIEKLKPAVKAFIDEAIEVERSGKEVSFKPTAEFRMPEEFLHKLDENPALAEAFYGLTPGRQRGYLLHFSGAKQSATRASRVEKCTPQILAGRGLNDQ